MKRQLIGSHPKTDAFPATSVNRTTTSPVETIFRDGDYTAVVTFLCEHETPFEIEESVSAAIVRAATDGIDRTAKEFLEQSDMRFRLNYTLGDFTKDQGEDEDPYADPEQDSIADEEPITDQDGNHAIVEGFVQRIWELAREYLRRVETELGALDAMELDDRSGALDLIQAEAEVSDEYAKIVSDVLEELRDRFSIVNIGRYEKSTTGWPKLWRLDTGNRREFFSGLRFFAGISATRWGRLLTPS